MLYYRKTLFILRRNKNISLTKENFYEELFKVFYWKGYPETIVAQSVAAKIFQVDPVVFEIWQFYHLTLWSAIVSMS